MRLIGAACCEQLYYGKTGRESARVAWQGPAQATGREAIDNAIDCVPRQAAV